MQRKVFKQNIFRYWKIWVLCLRASLKKSRSYKGEIFVRVIRTIFILLTQLLLLSVVFGNQEYLVGWSRSEAYLVLGVWNLLNYSGWAFFGVNLSALERHVVDGDFDFTLTKPISSAWLTSFGEFSMYNLISALSGIVLIGYYFVANWASVSITNVLFFVCSLILAAIIWYSIYLLFTSFTLSIPRNGFMSIAKEILGLTRYPTSIYVQSLQFVFYTVVPIAFVSTIPSEILIGKITPSILILGAGIAILLLRISYWVWKMNVKKFVSAGG